ncbi:MAG: hypothetical protein C5B55_02045 [Blastocatellia bacterium]|nr:MAG: hypothetical protein C5B55_02045 [Blastocatellia bacterium]
MAWSNLPPGEKWRNYELRALALRDFARVRVDYPLDPFKLAKFANLMVVDFEKIEGLSQESREQLLSSSVENWSGGACTLPNGMKLVILNPSHGRSRTNATLMEEICHVFLGHEPNRIGIVVQDAKGKMRARDYRQEDEDEAYGVGAAALVPFTALRRFVYQGKSSQDIGRHFGVSRELVEYRMKVTKLWRLYRDAHS